MTEERITRVEGPDGQTHTTTTTVLSDERRGGISSWFVLFLVLAAVLIGIWAFTQFGQTEMAKDDAVADAADKVGAAADKVGDAAQNAGEAVEDAADRAGGN